VDEGGKVILSGFAAPVPWWSFTKTVLAIAALRLVERGLLSLLDSIDGASYCLAHLLRHEAGLPDYGGVARYQQDVEAGKAPWPVDRLLTALDADRLRYAPGEGWVYSNIGYLKVAQIIERTSKLALGDALDELVFRPADATTAKLARTPQDLAGVQMGGAGGYRPGWVYHGLVTGTTADAALLLHALVSGALLRPETVALMVQGRALPEHRSALHSDPAYGLGLMQSAQNPLDNPIGHAGSGPGSKIAVYALNRRSCAIWEATSESADFVIEKVFGRLATSS
jgi:CubicO group peptidase (beta-lactamase class C family)